MKTKVYLAIGLAVLLSLVVWGIHHHGYAAGVDTATVKVHDAEAERDIAKKQAQDLADLFASVNAQADIEKAKALAQAQRADKAVQALADFKETHATEEVKWEKKLSKASSRPDCSILKELICPSVMDY